ncbi:BQ2448_6837 [Microbotryum intermedium]|uniref:BQ2448_6837 protein n=1 Tax=Microbotryum intermedium TaxID=269621 RepID=A0A238FML4_9BASI|nr:BQ2448_6837 [Microbotryum intermedium]
MRPLIARRSTLSRRPSLPTSMLPTLPRSLVGHSESFPASKLLSLVAHLRLLYATPPPPTRSGRTTTDSGYASTTSSEHADEHACDSDLSDDEDVDDLGKDDQLERGYARSFLSSLIKKSDEWIREAESQGDDEEKSARCNVIDEAAVLVAYLAETSASGSILRAVLLPTSAPDSSSPTEPLTITLNDALPSSLDPTSVGLQSWGSSILLARMIALNPTSFGIARGENEWTLELGAGTGLLSLVWKGMSERLGALSEEVIATDYHGAVLENLRRNVASNTPAISPSSSPFNSPQVRPTDSHPGSPLLSPHSATSSCSSLPVVRAYKLDWSAVHSSLLFSSTTNSPLHLPTPFDRPFHTLLAADVIYGPEHALWLKSCVQQFLIRPEQYTPKPRTRRVVQTPTPFSLDSIKDSLIGVEVDSQRTMDGPSPTLDFKPTSTSTSVPSPAFHLIVPLRPTHSKAIGSIATVFPLASDLAPRSTPESPYRVAIKRVTELQRVKGVGRADEESYWLYEIGWC